MVGIKAVTEVKKKTKKREKEKEITRGKNR